MEADWSADELMAHCFYVGDSVVTAISEPPGFSVDRQHITNVEEHRPQGLQRSHPAFSMDLMTAMMRPSCFFALLTAAFIISFENVTDDAFFSNTANASDE